MWSVCVQVALDLRQYGIYRALPVYGEPDFDSGPPTTAEEYLRRVRWAPGLATEPFWLVRKHGMQNVGI